MKLITLNLEQINNLCKLLKVKNLSVFGSILTNNFDDKSDVDLLVNFTEIKLLDYSDNYFDLKYALENLFKKNVDLVEEKAIKNPYFKKNIGQTKQLIYG